MKTPRDTELGSIADLAAKIRFARSPADAPGKTVFLIGAGCSISAGVPGAADIARRMTREVGERFECCAPGSDHIVAYQGLIGKRVLDPCPKGSPSESVSDDSIDWYKVYDEMFRLHYTAPDDVRDLFGTLVGEAKGATNWAHLCLGELVARGYVSTVLTTNFDQLVLSGLVQAGVLPVVCDGIESLNRIAGAPRHPQLVELHGSRHTYLLRNAPEDVKAVRDNPDASAAIQKLLQHATTFVAVGYGGREQGVMDLLIQAAAVYRDKNLYWINHSPDPKAVTNKVSEFLATSRNARLVPDQDADRFFLELCREMEVGSPRAISQPLQALERVIRDVSASRVSDTDIRAEIAAAEARFGRLKEFNSALPEQDAVETAISPIRERRLAGDHEAAYRLAREALEQMKDLAQTDHRVIEEAATAALEYGPYSVEAEPLRKAIQWFRFLVENETSKGTRRAKLVASLGEALWRMGERDPNSQLLKDAIPLLRASLSDELREEAPLDWAMTQDNLGVALQVLGERESGTARLEEAVAAFRAALDARPRERVPLDWATTQNNLGNALATLGLRESGTARLEEAVAAYRAALEERTRERVPLQWAGTQNNLGNALRVLGDRESGTARLDEAVAAYRAALQEYTRERVPRDWAMTQDNLGIALATLGVRESGTARLEEAVAAYRAALEERTRERVPLEWAMSTGNQGLALREIAKRRADLALAGRALGQIEAAFDLFHEAGHAPNAAFYEAKLPEARALVERLQDRRPGS